MGHLKALLSANQSYLRLLSLPYDTCSEVLEIRTLGA